MRQLIAALIVMLSLMQVSPVLGQGQDYLNPQYNFTATESMEAFLNDSWAPEELETPVDTATWSDKNNVTANSTPNIFLFLNDSWAPEAFEAPEDTATWPDKEGKLASASLNIYEFLKGSWTPSTPAAVVDTAPYKKGVMS